jgi:5-keto-L-gluconate epimerase
MKLSLAVQTPEVEACVPVALLSGTFAEKAAKARAFGADGLELMTVDPARLDVGEITAVLAEHDLEVAAIGSGAVAMVTGQTLLHPDASAAARAESRLAELIGFAERVGAGLVTIGGFRGRHGSTPPEGRARLAVILRSAGDQAAALGVRLAIEPLNRYEADLINTAEQGLSFLAEVDHPSVGLLLDTFHMNLEERSWDEPFSRLMEAGRLWHVHLGDNNRLAPGEGMIDFGHVVDILRGIGYAGFLSAELMALPDPDTAARTTLTHMRALLEH